MAARTRPWPAVPLKSRITSCGIVNYKRLGICLASEIGCSVRRAVSMAQKVQVLLVDDLDGSEATETVTFGLDGALYEIDLSSGNAGKLRKELAHYVEHARKASAPTRRRRARTGPGRERSAQIRLWAKQRGYKVNERGRIPANIVAEYEAAH
jgi:nucleoid-associated protein Lsr2